LNYSTIQDAINANETLSGQTISVDEGTYDENVVINKTLSIVGQNPDTTIVDSEQGDYAIMVTANNVTIEDFTTISTVHQESGTDRDSILLSGVQNCTITSNIITAGDVGLSVYSSSNNEIFQNNITAPLVGGRYSMGTSISFDYSSANRIYDNQIANSLLVSELLYSNDNIFFNNTFTNSGISISAECSGNVINANTISDTNTIGDNNPGITLGDEMDGRGLFWGLVENETVTNNTFVNSSIFADSTYGNTVENNTVNGAPIVYLEGASNLNITGAGQVILINCSQIEIENSSMLNTWVGVELRESQNIQVMENNMTGDTYGLLFSNSSDNVVSENNIVDGIRYGIELQSDSDNNRIYHNNLIGNGINGPTLPPYQVNIDSSSGNTLDNGYPSGGNYWSDYDGTDIFSGAYQNVSGSDGIGDTAYISDAGNVTDNYPLMGMFSDFNVAQGVDVQAVSNSTISNFQFNGTALLFNITGENGTTGFCRVSFPTALLNETLTVFVNGTEVPYTLLPQSDSTESYLYFTYSHSTEQVTIVPEFATFVLLPFFMIATLLVIVCCKKKVMLYKRLQSS
jgi:parallel beta-helix repeat protein